MYVVYTKNRPSSLLVRNTPCSSHIFCTYIDNYSVYMEHQRVDQLSQVSEYFYLDLHRFYL